MKQSFPVGSAVMIIGQPDMIYNSIGLYGFVEKIVKDMLYVRVLRDPELNGEDAKAEKNPGQYYQYHDSLIFCKDKDLVKLTGKARLARVARYQAFCLTEEKKEKPDPKWDELMDKLSSLEYIAEEKVEADTKAKRAAEMGPQYHLSQSVNRMSKADYPAYQGKEARAIEDERNTFVAKDRSQLTVDEVVKWTQANDILDQTSFLPDDEQVRALVHELDIDPYLNGHAQNLYKGKESIFVLRKDLRKEAIKLWNKGAVFTTIYLASGPDTCWAEYSKTPAIGFIIYYAFRRKLPIPA